MKQTIYVVSAPEFGIAEKLVSAPSQQSAISHVIKPLVICKLASKADIIRLLQSGTAVECVKAIAD